MARTPAPGAKEAVGVQDEAWRGMGIGLGSGLRGVARRLALRLLAVWVLLHVVAQQAALFAESRYFHEPVEAALRASGLRIAAVEVSLLWGADYRPDAAPGLAGGRPPSAAADIALLRREAGRWLAALATRLEIGEWRVIALGEGASRVLAYRGRSSEGEQVEVWLYASGPGPAGLPSFGGSGVMVRFRIDEPDHSHWPVAERWLPALPEEWRRVGRPRVFARWELEAPSDPGPFVERLSRVLGARTVAEHVESGRRVLWLASPRGANLGALVGSPFPSSRASLRIAWPAVSDGSGSPSRGERTVELLSVPHPLTEVVRAVERAWLL